MPDSTQAALLPVLSIFLWADAGVQRRLCYLGGRVPLAATLTDDYPQEVPDSIFGFAEEAACSFEEVLSVANYLIV